MDIWIQRIFLGSVLTSLTLLATPALAAEEQPAPEPVTDGTVIVPAKDISEPVNTTTDKYDEDLDIPEDARTKPASKAVELVDPKVERREIDISEIDAQDVEIGVFTGVMSVEDFGVNPVYGVFINYHVTEDIFVAASYGTTTTERTSFERLSGVDLLTDEQRDLQYYDLSVGLNLLPGEGFIGESWAFNSAFYATIGVGSTDFAGDQRFTIAWSAGYKMIVQDYLTLHVELEEHLFDIDILGATKISDNVSLQAGFSVYF